MRILLWAVAALVALLALSSCAGHGAYRIETKNCTGTIHLGDVNEENTKDGRASCMVQTYGMSAAYVRPPGAKLDPFQPDEFQLSFVELGSKIPKDKQQDQINKLRSVLTPDKQNYLIVFVHGWRHNASVGDHDVKKVRTMLAYARSFLNTRCTDEARYCNARLTGLYIGWRGASFLEPPGENIVGTIGAAPTFWARKAESERLAPELYALLKDVGNSLRLDPGNPAADKMLVVGHSFGGNMLATGLKDPMIRRVKEHPMGTHFAPEIGDLTVLINPASDATNWTDIQKEIAGRVGRDIIAGEESPNDDFEKIFAADQRPNYLSITSSCNWSVSERPEKDRNLPLKCDIPTGYLFPLGQAYTLSQEHFTTIGHLDPVYEERALPGTNDVGYRLRPGTRRLGTTHEFTILQGAGYRTDFGPAANPKLSRCDIADGWLRAAQARWPQRRGRDWDSGYGPGPGKANSVLWVDKARGIAAQFRHKLFLEGTTGSQPSIASANSPFWNVRAHDTMIAGHNSFVGYPLWCSVNQLVLDDVITPLAVAPSTSASN